MRGLKSVKLLSGIVAVALFALFAVSVSAAQTIEDYLLSLDSLKLTTNDSCSSLKFLEKAYWNDLEFKGYESTAHEDLTDYFVFATKGKFYEPNVYETTQECVANGSNLTVGSVFVPLFLYYSTYYYAYPFVYDEDAYKSIESERRSLLYRWYAYEALRMKGTVPLSVNARLDSLQLENFVGFVSNAYPDRGFEYDGSYASNKGDTLYHVCVMISAGVCCGPHTCHYCFCKFVNVFNTPLSYARVAEALIKSLAYKEAVLHERQSVERMGLQAGGLTTQLENFDIIATDYFPLPR